MRLLILLAILAGAPAQASELWCMPDKICAGTDCHVNTDTEMSIRLHDPDGATPLLRADAQDIPMTKTKDAEMVQWEGVNDFGLAKILTLQTNDMQFAFTTPLGGKDLIATGTCEVQ